MWSRRSAPRVKHGKICRSTSASRPSRAGPAPGRRCGAELRGIDERNAHVASQARERGVERRCSRQWCRRQGAQRSPATMGLSPRRADAPAGKPAAAVASDTASTRGAPFAATATFTIVGWTCTPSQISPRRVPALQGDAGKPGTSMVHRRHRVEMRDLPCPLSRRLRASSRHLHQSGQARRERGAAPANQSVRVRRPFREPATVAMSGANGRRSRHGGPP